LAFLGVIKGGESSHSSGGEEGVFTVLWAVTGATDRTKAILKRKIVCHLLQEKNFFVINEYRRNIKKMG
jgi:hypothetical protein